MAKRDRDEARARERTKSDLSVTPCATVSGASTGGIDQKDTIFIANAFAAAVALTMWAPSVVVQRKDASGPNRSDRPCSSCIAVSVGTEGRNRLAVR